MLFDTHCYSWTVLAVCRTVLIQFLKLLFVFSIKWNVFAMYVATSDAEFKKISNRFCLTSVLATIYLEDYILDLKLFLYYINKYRRLLFVHDICESCSWDSE